MSDILKELEDLYQEKFGVQEIQTEREIELNKILNHVYKNQVKMRNEKDVEDFVKEWLKK